MSNVMDYIDWRGDLSFEQSPFNEVDNLILSVISYVQMDRLVGMEYEKGVSFETLNKLYAVAHYNQSKEFLDPAPMLSKICTCERYKNTRIFGYETVTRPELAVQFAAVSFDLGDLIYVAYRGTDATLAGWKEDFTMSYLESTPGQRLAVEYVNMIGDMTDKPLILGGHSKGGNSAMYAAAFMRDDLKASRLVKVYSNDGPGFNRALSRNSEIREIYDKVELIIPESSMVGTLLTNKKEKRIIKSSQKGILQHHPYSWDVMGCSFVPAEERSDYSRFVDESISRWLETLSDDQLNTFTNAIFDALAAAGAKTIIEINGNPVAYYNAILKAIRVEDEKQGKIITDLIRSLGVQSRDLFWNEAMKRVEQNAPALPQAPLLRPEPKEPPAQKKHVFRFKSERHPKKLTLKDE